jgi:hypothetical protein
MKSKIALWLELGVVALVVSTLAGCFGDGASPNYDGAWTAAIADSNAVTISGVTATCTLAAMPNANLTLTSGIGSFNQTNNCVYTVSGVSYTQTMLYLVSVAITTSTGAVQAIVNGSTITGQCISYSGCAAQGGGRSLSLTR